MGEIAKQSADRVRDRRDGFMKAVIDRYENGEWWRFTINLALVVGGGILAGLARLDVFEAGAQAAMAIIGLIMVALGAGLVAWFDLRRTDLTREAKSSLALSEDILAEKAQLEATIEAAQVFDSRRRFLLQAVQRMHEAVERVPHGTPLAQVIEAMLDAGSSDLEGAIGFEAGEKWAFSIFQRQLEKSGSRTEVMRRIAVSWADRQREKDREPREWKKKNGFTGTAWQRDDDVIEADLRAPEVAGQYPVPKTQQKPGDEQQYVSVAAIPIRVGTVDEMWGLVTATSDMAGRWRRAVTDPREQNVLAVRILSQLVAMQVALRDGWDARPFKNGE